MLHAAVSGGEGLRFLDVNNKITRLQGNIHIGGTEFVHKRPPALEVRTETSRRQQAGVRLTMRALLRLQERVTSKD